MLDSQTDHRLIKLSFLMEKKKKKVILLPQKVFLVSRTVNINYSLIIKLC